MPVHNEDVARIFDEIADLLDVQGDNPFRIRAYRNAARTLRALGGDIGDYRRQHPDLSGLPGIGKDLAAKIGEILDTGQCRTLAKLRQQVPHELTELLQLPGLGPKRVQALYHELDIHTLEQLERAARDGRVRELSGFGAKMETRILEALQAHSDTGHRFKLATAAQYAESLARYLRAGTGVDRVEVAGSFRRCRDTVGDLDILVIASEGRPVVQRFVGYDEVAEVLAQGGTRASVVLKSGLQVDLRVVPAVSFGAAMYYFTGSRAHNIAVRQIAQRRGLKVNEYGLYKGEKRIAGDTEESIFKALGLAYIEPELRENRGEIEAARNGQLPDLVKLANLRGDLHAHTTATDGRASLAELAAEARRRGFEYLGITDHSRRLAMVHGLDSRRLLRQVEEIDRLNEELHDLTLLKGIECDILEDGSLDLPDNVLGQLDFVIGAVHSRFGLSRAQQTRRILRAMDDPYFTLLAHPSGRRLGEREPYDVDMTRLIRHARERGCFLELNAHPERLDLLAVYCQQAREEGVLVAIDSDAHALTDFDNLRFGIGQARRGWLEPKDVLNTRPLAELRRLLSSARRDSASPTSGPPS